MRVLASRVVFGLAGLSLLLAGPLPARAGNILISGGEMDSTIQSYLTALGDTSTIVDPANFNSASFNGFSAIWLGSEATFNGLAGRQADLTTFMQNGGTILVEIIPGFNNPLSDYPLGSTLTDAGSAVNIDSVHIVATSSPVNANLTDVGLSGWLASTHDFFTGLGSFTGLTNDGIAGQWVTISADVGLGHIVFTGQDISFHIKNGLGDTGPTSPKGVFLNNVLSLPPLSGPATPEPSTLAMAGAAGVMALITWRWRRRRAVA